MKWWGPIDFYNEWIDDIFDALRRDVINDVN